MKYYKVQKGYGDDYIPIDETELEKALYAHATGKTVFLKEGSVSGKVIMSVVPDYNRTMGWNAGYKPTAEDWGDVRKELGSTLTARIAEAKVKVNQVISSGRLDLLEEGKKLEELAEFNKNQ